MNRSAIDLWVGIFVVIGIGAIVFLALKVGNLTSLQTTPTYRLEAAFDNIGGLKLRAPVKAAGVVVGRVDRVRFDPKTYRAVVTMSIDNGYPFSTDTIASILTSGLLGEVYIGLDAGGDTKMLADGGMIAKTQSAVVLEKLIGQFLFDKAATLGGGK
ncbi:MAG TPA: outer membrane lipid asymmetry maintenance protein MlaD [Casimicrobiaceae bacterium]